MTCDTQQHEGSSCKVQSVSGAEVPPQFRAPGQLWVHLQPVNSNLRGPCAGALRCLASWALEYAAYQDLSAASLNGTPARRQQMSDPASLQQTNHRHLVNQHQVDPQPTLQLSSSIFKYIS